MVVVVVVRLVVVGIGKRSDFFYLCKRGKLAKGISEKV